MTGQSLPLMARLLHSPTLGADDWTITVLVRGGLANSKLAGAEAHGGAGRRVYEWGEGGREPANKCDREKQTRK